MADATTTVRMPADTAGAQAAALPAGLFGPDQVDVGYEPWRALQTAALHVGPSLASPVVIAPSGERVVLSEGNHFGRQTTRNPGCRDRPPLRAGVDGFVWGYGIPPASRKSGWLRLADLEADPEYDGLACGPARADFDRRRPNACGGHCDGRPLTAVSRAAGRAEVTAQDLYLRYAPGSTAFRYLVEGDEVRLLVQRRGPGLWYGVEVVRAEWTPRRGRGWVLASGVTITGG